MWLSKTPPFIINILASPVRWVGLNFYKGVDKRNGMIYNDYRLKKGEESVLSKLSQAYKFIT
jgi:hypothetical protein